MIYLAYGYNEAVSGGNAPNGAWFCAGTLRKRGVRSGCAFDESGSTRNGRPNGIDAEICAINVAEKGYVDFGLSRTDSGGHSPYKDGVLDYVARVILALRNHPYLY